MKDVSQPYGPFSLCFDYGSVMIFSNLALGVRFKVPDEADEADVKQIFK